MQTKKIPFIFQKQIKGIFKMQPRRTGQAQRNICFQNGLLGFCISPYLIFISFPLAVLLPEMIL